MEPDLKHLSDQELSRRIEELETSYAEALMDDADIHALSKIWNQIKQLKMELERRNAP